MNKFDRNVRLAVYRHFVSKNKAPAANEIALDLNVATEQIHQSFDRLADEHVLVIDPDTQQIRMAMPFSALPTAYEVTIDEKAWWAN